MNERIMELAIKARQYAESNPDIYQVAYDKKFAELIVRESMIVTKDYTCNQGWDYSAPVALARHFGVGE